MSILTGSHCLNLFTKVAQFPAVVETHEGAKDASEQHGSYASLDPEAGGAKVGASFTLGRDPLRLSSSDNKLLASDSDANRKFSCNCR